MTDKERLEMIKHDFEVREGFIEEYDVRWLIEQAEKAERYEKALKEIAESDEDSSCNEIAIKYEVIADKAVYGD